MDQERTSTPVAADGADATAAASWPQDEALLEDFLIGVCRLTSTISDSPIFSDNGVGPAEWVLLKVLETGPLSISELVRQSNVSRQRVGVLVKELQSKKFLSVSAQLQGDRRTRIVRILPSGSTALEKISRRLQSLNIRKSPRRFAGAVRQTHTLLRTLRRERHISAQARP
jgi:DNA-binding MarR family transcriptional regulator